MPDRPMPSAAGTIALSGSLIGPYRLLEKIGEGGFGEVWLAEQKEPVKRRVAIKIIKLGMDTRQVVARFEAERQALAMMDHPNIAKVLDAGATDLGRPFFVMELVKGIPITDYCERNGVALKERLDLFMQVCRAIQHAHQKGIIHRDIKPSNILVTMQDGSAVPKVIDFGIAKATQMELTEKTLHTQLNQFIGTPAYMSPEQAEMTGIDIDTRSDIYSLGVLLYELLTGTTPFDTKELLSAGLDEMRRMIREKEPVRPSTRVSQIAPAPEPDSRASPLRLLQKERIAVLRGDLDWIVMTCLEKDRTRRYETANGLAMDIDRHLRHEPINARPPNLGYKVQKFVSRNRLLVGGSALLILTLCAAVIFSTAQAVRASRAGRAQRAQRAAAENARQNEQRTREAAQAAELQARRNLYAADMLLAYNAESKGHLGQTRKILDGYLPASLPRGSPDLRGWEWRHLRERVKGMELFALRGHSNQVLVSGFVNAREVFSAGNDGTIRLWDILSRASTLSFAFPDLPRAGDVSPGGRFVVVAGLSGRWAVIDASSGKLVRLETNELGFAGVRFSPDGAWCALVDHRRIALRSVPDFRPGKMIDRSPSRADEGNVVAGVAFSPDSRHLAYGFTADDRIVVQDLKTGEVLPIGRARRGEALALAFSPRGDWLAAGDRQGIQLWHFPSRELRHTLTNHLEQVVSLDFSPDGSLLASGSGDQTVRLFAVDDHFRCTRTLRGHEHEIHCVRFSPDGKLLISSSMDETLRLWDPSSEEHLQRRSFEAAEAVFTHTGALLSRGRSALFRLEIPTLSLREVSAPKALFEAPRFCANPEGEDFAWPEPSGQIAVWNSESGKTRTAGIGATNGIHDLALNQHANILAILRANREIEFWNVEANSLLKTLDELPGTTKDRFPSGEIRFHGSNLLVQAAWPAGLGDPHFAFIRLPDFQRRVLRHPLKGFINQYALDRQGKRLATASWNDAVKLWDIETGDLIAAFEGQLIGFTAVTFSPDGTRLAAGAWDGTITIWDLQSLRQVAHWKAHRTKCGWLNFADDQVLTSASGIRREPVEFAIWAAP